MLAEKKISVNKAERLLALTEQPAGSEATTSDISQVGKPKPKPKYMRVVAEPDAEAGRRPNLIA